MNNKTLAVMIATATAAVLIICSVFFAHWSTLSKQSKQIANQQHFYVLLTDLQSTLKSMIAKRGIDDGLANKDDINIGLTRHWQALMPYEGSAVFSMHKLQLRPSTAAVLVGVSASQLVGVIEQDLAYIEQSKRELRAHLQHLNQALSHQLQQFFIIFALSMALVIINVIAIIYFYFKQQEHFHQQHNSHRSDLEKEQDKLKQSVKEKSNLLHMLNQEVRTPLHQIAGVVSLLEQDYDLEGIEHSRRKADLAKFERFSLLNQSINELLAVLNNVLSYTEIDSGVLSLKNEATNLKDLLQFLQAHFQPAASNKNIVLSSSVDAKLPPCINVDELRIKQVLIHIIKNAFKYTQEGEITLTCQALEDNKLLQHWDYQGDSSQAFVLFTVKDTGCGINQSDLKLMNTVMSNSVNQHNQFATSCLGMAITQKMVGLMGGVLHFESQAGKGTEVFMAFPLQISSRLDVARAQQSNQVAVNVKPEALVCLSSEEFEQQQQWDDPESAQGKNTGRILIAEDVESNADLLCWMLEDMGHEVLISTNGEECITMLEKNEVDLIFMDQFMPVMDGQSATIKIRCMANPKKSRIPIIGCTADPNKDTHEMLMQAGQNGVMTKPMDVYALQQVLKEHLRLPTKKANVA